MSKKEKNKLENDLSQFEKEVKDATDFSFMKSIYGHAMNAGKLNLLSLLSFAVGLIFAVIFLLLAVKTFTLPNELSYLFSVMGFFLGYFLTPIYPRWKEEGGNKEIKKNVLQNKLKASVAELRDNIKRETEEIKEVSERLVKTSNRTLVTVFKQRLLELETNRRKNSARLTALEETYWRTKNDLRVSDEFDEATTKKVKSDLGLMDYNDEIADDPNDRGNDSRLRE